MPWDIKFEPLINAHNFFYLFLTFIIYVVGLFFAVAVKETSLLNKTGL